MKPRKKMERREEAREPKTSQVAHEVILTHTVSQVSDLFGKHTTSSPARHVVTAHRQHLTSREEVPVPFNLWGFQPDSWPMASFGILGLALLFFSEYNSVLPITLLCHPPCPLQIQLLTYFPLCFQDNHSNARIWLSYSSSKINSVINRCPKGKIP